ncbi:lipase [Nocardioides sp. ChNu-153]|uniref:lipase family protein n=1 Tax=Nocardioides sp. ChNu-153 TaxID=2779364 RepID=UPI002654F55B|nr:lipase family protein [Nocardioides sp. ChNu-153]MDN7122803.1 lipase [Nocardioides sp. ChNu-153]
MIRRTAVVVGLAALVLLALAWPTTTLRVLPWLLAVALVVGGGFVALRTGVHDVVRRVRGDQADTGRGPTRRSGRDRPRVPTWLLVGAAAVPVLLLVATVVVHVGSRPTLDAFYAAPDDDEVPAEAGRLVRQEPFTTDVPDGAEGWRILYTTRDAAGEPALASATVVAPTGRPEALPAVAVGHGTTGVARPCAPSASSDPFAGAKAALAEVVAAGAVAVTTDYVGLGAPGRHAYLDGPAAGANVLDSVRAAGELRALAPTTVVWGHSQGGHAALWAGRLAPSYAPEVGVAGVAALAPATDLTALVRDLSGPGGDRVLNAYLAVTWDETYDLGLRDDEGWLAAHLADRVASRCLVGRDAVAAWAAASQLRGPVLGEDDLDRADVADRLVANTPTVPDVPVLVAQGAADVVVRADLQRRWIAERCAAGETPRYVEYDGLDHGSLVADSSPLTAELVAWTRARLAGEPATDPTC